MGGEGFGNVGVALENGGKVEVRACLNQTYYYCYFDLGFSWVAQNVSLLYWDYGWGKRVHEIHFVVFPFTRIFKFTRLFKTIEY